MTGQQLRGLKYGLDCLPVEVMKEVSLWSVFPDECWLFGCLQGDATLRVSPPVFINGEGPNPVSVEVRLSPPAEALAG